MPVQLEDGDRPTAEEALAQKTARRSKKQPPLTLKQVWDMCGEAMYDMSPSRSQQGFGDEGVSAFYGSNVTVDDADTAAVLAFWTWILGSGENDAPALEALLRGCCLLYTSPSPRDRG